MCVGCNVNDGSSLGSSLHKLDWCARQTEQSCFITPAEAAALKQFVDAATARKKPAKTSRRK